MDLTPVKSLTYIGEIALEGYESNFLREIAGLTDFPESQVPIGLTIQSPELDHQGRILISFITVHQDCLGYPGSASISQVVRPIDFSQFLARIKLLHVMIYNQDFEKLIPKNA